MPNLVFLIPVSFFVMLACIGTPLARAVARRIEAKGERAAVPSDIGERLERIESAIETMAIEVERISEAQRFTSRLLAGRADGAPAQPALGAPSPTTRA